MATQSGSGNSHDVSAGQPFSSSTSQSSLSKYFGQPDSGDDVFSSLVKPESREEPKIISAQPDVSSNAANQPVESGKPETSVKQSTGPTVSFTKSEDAEPKIFSYFAKAEEESDAVKDPSGKSFFDLLSKQNTPTSGSETRVITTTKDSNSTPVTVANVERFPSPAPVATNRATFPEAEYENLPKTWSSTEETFLYWWIPNSSAEAILASLNLPGGIQNVDKLLLVTPALSTEAELGDPLGEMLRHYDGDAAAANRTVLTADSVTQDDRGIRQLIQAGFFRAAINLCGRLLTAYGQGSSRPAQATKHTPHSLQLWFTRLALLVKTEQFGVAETEAAAFGDLNSADLLFQFYPELYGNRKGSMVPFGMRLLLAQLPSLVGRISETQQKLHQILRTVRQILQNIDTLAGDKNSPADLETARKLWKSRERTVSHYFINSTILQRDYRSAVRLLQQQLEDPAESKASLLSVLGRVYLQFGDVKSAQAAFHQAADLRDKSLPAECVDSLVDAALVAIAQNAFTEAHRLLEQALLLDPQNPLVINNKAVCLLYMGQMQQAMQYLEESIGTKPDLMLLDPTVVNVCTLYELETSLTMQRKLGMLRLASQWRSDSFSVHNFKLQL